MNTIPTKTPDEIDAHLKKIKRLEGLITLKKGRSNLPIEHTKNQLFKLFYEFTDGIESQKSESNPEGLMGYLKNNELPSDILFHNDGPEGYYAITHNPSSPYSMVYDADIAMLLDLAHNKPTYIHQNIIDIGCGDGIKGYILMQELLKKKKITGTIDYLGLDDSGDMLKFAKKIFYNNFYSKTHNQKGGKYIDSDDIDPTIKKIRPWFQKTRFQNIKGLENRTPKTMMFLGGTFGNLPNNDENNIQKQFLDDINGILQKDDTFILSYFRVLDNNGFNTPDMENLIKNFFEKEKARYAEHDVSYQEKEIDIKNLKKALPGINIDHDDFDIHLEFDEKNQIIYDVRTYNKDIIYNGQVVIYKGESFKSSGTKIDYESQRQMLNERNITKDFTESLYSTKETDGFINNFLRTRDINPKDYFIKKDYDVGTNTLHITIHPLAPITFKREEGEGGKGKTQEITKYPGDIISVHKSKRFSDDEIKKIISDSGLLVVDEIGYKSPLIDQDVMKLFIIKKQ